MFYTREKLRRSVTMVHFPWSIFQLECHTCKYNQILYDKDQGEERRFDD